MDMPGLAGWYADFCRYLCNKIHRYLVYFKKDFSLAGQWPLNQKLKQTVEWLVIQSTKKVWGTILITELTMNL